MSNIEVGYYLRIFGMITKVTAIDKDYIDVNNKELICIPKSSLKYTIYKHSKNIIDLIEVGDYVNGYPVASMYGCTGVCLNINYQKHGISQIVEIQDIKSIVTKEMYKSIEYRVGE